MYWPPQFIVVVTREQLPAEQQLAVTGLCLRQSGKEEPHVIAVPTGVERRTEHHRLSLILHITNPADLHNERVFIVVSHLILY